MAHRLAWAAAMSVLGIIAIVIAITAYVPYLWEVLRGQGRPNRASWMIFSATGLFTAASAWVGGAREGLWLPLTYGLLSSVVVVVSIRRGEGGWTLLDRCCLTTALLSLVGWWISGDPLVCVAMNTLADTVGHLPTIRKSWRTPRSEPMVMWWSVCIANLCNVAQVEHWTALEVMYPISLAVNSVIVIAVCLAARWRLRRVTVSGVGL